MDEKKIDRRVQKTKKALTEGLIHLIVEKGYEKVTIQDIIDRANVGRSTFYIHYENKEQLLKDGHNNLNVPIFEDAAENPVQMFLNIFNHILENKNLAKAMLGKGGGNMMAEFFKNNLALKVKRRYRNSFSNDVNEQKMLTYLSEATAAVVLSLLVSWLEDDMSFSALEMSNKCQSIVAAIFNK